MFLIKKTFLLQLDFSLILLAIAPVIYQFPLVFPNNFKCISESCLEKRIHEILKLSAHYCQKLKNISLFFVCQENLTERTYYSLPDKVKMRLFMSQLPKDYLVKDFRVETRVYDYQLIRLGKKFQEKRDLLEENGQKKYKKNVSLKTTILDYKYPIFGPIGVLGQEAQKRHDYKLVGEEIIGGVNCLILQATPKPSLKANHLYGKIWISQEDGSVLKIEWNPESIKNYEEILKTAERINAKPNITYISEYGIMEKGIRLPSLCYFKEEYIHPRLGNVTFSEVIVNYEDYKFFVVETEISLEKIRFP